MNSPKFPSKPGTTRLELVQNMAAKALLKLVRGVGLKTGEVEDSKPVSDCVVLTTTIKDLSRPDGNYLQSKTWQELEKQVTIHLAKSK